MNHILKLNQIWTPHKLPQLINKLYDEILLQEALIKGALYGHGDLELNHNVLHLRCTKQNWQAKTEKQKNAILHKFINYGLEKPNLKIHRIN